MFFRLLWYKGHSYVMEYLCHKWPRICSTCREHFPVLSSFMTYHRVCYYINTTGAISGAGTTYPSGAPEFIPVFSGVRVTRSLVLWVCFVDRFFLPLCCQSFFNLRILVTPFISSNSFYIVFILFVVIKKKVWRSQRGKQKLYIE